jgi:spore germination cell wall hydrolase CwlJ-like protein
MTLSVLCLALVVYTEARGEPYEGQVMVAEVVLNRSSLTAYPDSVCDVAYQSKQFSGMTDDIAILEPEAWDVAVDVAFTVMEKYDKGSEATHFHATSVTPYWSKKLTKVDSLGGHIFYKE